MEYTISIGNDWSGKVTVMRIEVDSVAELLPFLEVIAADYCPEHAKQAAHHLLRDLINNEDGWGLVLLGWWDTPFEGGNPEDIPFHCFFCEGLPPDWDSEWGDERACNLYVEG